MHYMPHTLRLLYVCLVRVCSAKNFDQNSEFADAWKKDNDGGANVDGPRPMVGDQGGAWGGYITK